MKLLSNLSIPREPEVTDPTRGATIDTLSYPEKLVLWAIRMWVRAYRTEDRALFSAAQSGLVSAGLSESAAHALDAFMTIITISTTADIDIRCPRCSNVSRDEHRFLAAVADAQGILGETRMLDSGDVPNIRRGTLSPWLPPEAERLTFQPLTDLAQDLSRLSLVIRARPWVRTSPIDGAPIPFRGRSPVRTLH